MSDIVKFGKPIKVPTLPADPAGTESGVLYYNSTIGSLRSFEGGQWKDTSPISQELSLVKSPSTAVGWSETGTVFATPVTATTSGDLPLAGIIDSAIQLIATGNGAEASNYSSYSITMPESLKNTKLKIEWYQRTGSGFVDGEWTISIYSGSTRMSLSTDSSGATTIPALNGKFTTTFDSDGSSSYTLRFARTSGSGSATLNIANVIVGPGIQPQGAVVGEWQIFTMTIGATTTPPTKGTIALDVARWRRVGSSMEIEWRYRQTVAGSAGTGTYTYPIPDNKTVDTSVLELAQIGSGNVGVFNARSGATATDAIGFVRVRTSTTLEATVQQDDTTPADVGSTSNGLDNAAQKYYLHAIVPIAEWAGSGTVNLAQNEVEYVYNTNTSDAADTTSFGYGPQGALIGSFTVQRSKRVQFQTPIQPNDSFIIEVNNDNQPGSAWQPASDAGLGYVRQGTIDFGISIAPIVGTTNQATVTFHDYGTPTNTAYGNGTGATAWSAYNVYRWRVKKVRGGQAVGFGEVAQTSSGLVKSAGQLKGTNTNDAAIDGYVGEHLSQSRLRSAAVALTDNVAANVTATALTLTPGDWDIQGMVGFDPNTSVTTTAISGAISTTSATLPATDSIANPFNSAGNVRGQMSWPSGAIIGDMTINIPSIRVSISSNTTFYLVAACAFTSGSVNAFGAIWARRVR